MSRAINFCFTLNNPTAEELTSIGALGADVGPDSLVTYLLFGREIATTGTPHLQGYIQLSKRQTWNQVKTLISRRIHILICRGSPEANRVYCTKDSDFTEFGVMRAARTGQGKRTDLVEIKAILDDGGTVASIADSHFSQWCYLKNSFKEFHALKQVKRNWVCEVFCYWGDTGTGKTQKVFELEPDVFVCPDNQLRWFDGYTGEDAVLFDDFLSVKNEKFPFLLKLLDSKRMDVPVKGGFVNWKPRRIYFTSNVRVQDWFMGVSAQSSAALLRRFTTFLEFKSFF